MTEYKCLHLFDVVYDWSLLLFSIFTDLPLSLQVLEKWMRSFHKQIIQKRKVKVSQ